MNCKANNIPNIVLLCMVAVMVPLRFSHAQFVTFADLIGRAIGLINVAIPVVLALSLLVFLWGIIKLIGSGGDEKNIKEGKQTLIRGVIGLFLMTCVWGLVLLIQATFGLR